MTTYSNQGNGETIKESHELDGDVDALTELYEDWAETYNQDVSSEDYEAPRYIVKYMETILENDAVSLPTEPSELKINDAGCGTGLVGIELKKRGYEHVDGFDLSDAMVDLAKETEAYSQLFGQCDMTKRINAFDDDSYDVILCAGVFTLGHVFPSALIELIHLTKPGGVLVTSTRKRYAEESHFGDFCKHLENEGRISILDVNKNAPYIAEEPAHYWALQVH